MYLIPLIIFSIVAILILLVSYFKSGLSSKQSKPDIDVYKAQLNELESDLERGIVTEDEANKSRIEIERRILSAASSEQKDIKEEAPNTMIAVVLLVTLLTAPLLYPVLGTPDMPDYPRSIADEARMEGEQGEEYKNTLELRDKLISQLADRAPDAQGLVYLSHLEMNLGNFQSAAEALYQAQVIDPDSFDLQLMYGESLIVAAKERVTPAALVVLNRATKMQPDHPGPKYYLALADYQAGDIEIAYRDWFEISKGLDGQSPLKPLVDFWANRAGRELGVVQGLPETRAPSISSEQAEAIQNMDEGEQAELIHQMVLQLAEKQSENPGNIEGWLRLSRAYMVLGQKQDAIDAMQSDINNAPDQQKAILKKELEKLTNLQ